MTDIRQELQSPAPGKLVRLFQLDLTPLGGALLYFTPDVNPGGTVTFDSHVYTAIPIEADGFEVATSGEQPRPTLRIGNVHQGNNLPGAVTGLVIQYDDLVGAILKRIRTFAQHLDGAPDADPTAIIDIQIYRIVRKARQNRVFIEWELANPLDHDAAMIPKGQILPDYCRAIYRRWDPVASDFVYDTTTLVCPFVDETKAFDIQDQATTLANDRCSKTLGGCRARFGATAALPFMGEPGIGKVR
jgi:lambda family phage minor tail protein L